MPTERYDWSRPSVQAYVQAVLALTPADWERLAAAFREQAARHAIERARAEGHPDPAHALPPVTPPMRGWRRVAEKALKGGLTRMQDLMLAPAWQRQGVGPARLLYERFQHPYVSLQTRHVIEVGLHYLWLRPHVPTLAHPIQRDLVRLLNMVVPWDAIWTTPDADGSVGRLAPEPEEKRGAP